LAWFSISKNTGQIEKARNYIRTDTEFPDFTDFIYWQAFIALTEEHTVKAIVI